LNPGSPVSIVSPVAAGVSSTGGWLWDAPGDASGDALEDGLGAADRLGSADGLGLPLHATDSATSMIEITIAVTFFMFLLHY